MASAGDSGDKDMHKALEKAGQTLICLLSNFVVPCFLQIDGTYMSDFLCYC